MLLDPAARCLTATGTAIQDTSRQLLTGKDNKTHDLGKWSWAICLAACLALAYWHERQKVRVTLQELSISLTTIAAGHAAALGLKSKTEPE
jgi:hypothetical protein